MITPPPICVGCALRQGSLRAPKCDAFPKRIPVAILTNRADHREPFGADGGVTFEAVSPEADDYAEWVHTLQD